MCDHPNCISSRPPYNNIIQIIYLVNIYYAKEVPSMQPNHVIAMFGAFLILMSVLGLVLVDSQEPGQRKVVSDLKKYHLTFSVESDSVSTSATTNDGASSEGRLLVQPANVTGATMIITWNDNKPRLAQAATVNVAITDPNGGSYSGSGSDGGTGISIPVTFGSPPAETDLEAKSEDDAKNRAAKEFPGSNNGTGEWVVTISSDRSGVFPIVRSGNVAWTCTIEFEYYTLEVSEVASEKKAANNYQALMVLEAGVLS
jgi:hypothetical protein